MNLVKMLDISFIRWYHTYTSSRVFFFVAVFGKKKKIPNIKEEGIRLYYATII